VEPSTLPEERLGSERIEVNAPILDSGMIATLFELDDGEGEVLRELVTLFSEDAPERLAEMKSASASGDGDLLRRAAHTLKGSARNLGAGRLAAVCEVMEERAKNGELRASSALIGQAGELMEEAIASLAERIGKAAA